MRNRLIPLCLLAAIACGAWYFWSASDTAHKKHDDATPVEVLKVYQDTIYDSVESLGTALANESVTLTANVNEAITAINFTDGQEVKKGDLIAELSQKEELAQLAGAKAREKEDERELKRLKTLLRNKAAAQREYDERMTQLEITKREIEEIQARIADRTLRAPFDGVLGIRRVSVGALVQAGDVITTIDDLSRIKLDFTVPALYLDSLQVGVPIEARRDGGDNRVFHGEIASVNTRIDPVTRSVLVRAILPNDDKLLRPGLLMRVTLLRNQRQALLVAEESVIQRQNNHFVLVVPEGGGKVEQRKIAIGSRRPGAVEVLDGLREGENVITRGVNMVTDGQEAQIAKTWDAIRPPLATNETAGDTVPESPAPLTTAPQEQ